MYRIVVLVVKTFERQSALRAYQERLAMLRLSPTSTSQELRQETLNLGRAYSVLTRNRFGFAYFDETALMNDINAASAGSSFRPSGQIPLATSLMDPLPMQAVRTKAEDSIEARLAKLFQLREQGYINDDEYQAQRKRLLDEV